MKHVRFIFITIPIIFYRFLTRKAYYITGTYLRQDKQRMFFKTTFVTYGNVLPIKSLEIALSRELKSDVIILNFQRLPRGMVKYIESDFLHEIEMESLNS